MLTDADIRFCPFIRFKSRCRLAAARLSMYLTLGDQKAFVSIVTHKKTGRGIWNRDRIAYKKFSNLSPRQESRVSVGVPDLGIAVAAFEYRKHVPVLKAVDGASSWRCKLKGKDQNCSLIYTFKQFIEVWQRIIVIVICYGFNIWKVRQDTGCDRSKLDGLWASDLKLTENLVFGKVALREPVNRRCDADEHASIVRLPKARIRDLISWPYPEWRHHLHKHLLPPNALRVSRPLGADPMANRQKRCSTLAAGRVGFNRPWRLRHFLTEERGWSAPIMDNSLTTFLGPGVRRRE